MPSPQDKSPEIKKLKSDMRAGRTPLLGAVEEVYKPFQMSQVSYNIIRTMFNDPLHITNTDTLGRIADALGVPPSELIEEYKPEKN